MLFLLDVPWDANNRGEGNRLRQAISGNGKSA